MAYRPSISPAVYGFNYTYDLRDWYLATPLLQVKKLEIYNVISRRQSQSEAVVYLENGLT